MSSFQLWLQNDSSILLKRIIQIAFGHGAKAQDFSAVPSKCFPYVDIFKGSDSSPDWSLVKGNTLGRLETWADRQLNAPALLCPLWISLFCWPQTDITSPRVGARSESLLAFWFFSLAIRWAPRLGAMGGRGETGHFALRQSSCMSLTPHRKETCLCFQLRWRIKCNAQAHRVNQCRRMATSPNFLDLVSRFGLSLFCFYTISWSGSLGEPGLCETGSPVDSWKKSNVSAAWWEETNSNFSSQRKPG